MNSLYLQKQRWNAMRAIAPHKLLGEEYWDDGRGARWLIGQEGTFVGRCEIIAGIGGSLVVHGDYDLCRFAHYSDTTDAWDRLLWMADCTDLDYYVAQKASIGLRRQDIMEYDEDEAKADLERLIADSEDSDPEMIALLREAIEDGHTETREGLMNFLGHGDKGWDLWEHRFGEVLSFRVVISHAALNKCAWLLRERYGDLGPPQCRGIREARRNSVRQAQSLARP